MRLFVIEEKACELTICHINLTLCQLNIYIGSDATTVAPVEAYGPIPYGNDEDDGTFIQDYAGFVTVPNSNNVTMYGNSWKAFKIQNETYDLIKSSTLQFKFSVTAKAEGHAICLVSRNLFT